MDEKVSKLADALQTHGHFLTTPVAVKLVKADDTVPQKVKRPLEHIGNKLAVCQGMSIARTIGWAMAFGEEDHACPLPQIFMGHVKPDRFLNGAIAEFYQDDPDCRVNMEAAYPRWPQDSFREVWLAPISKCRYVPDLVVAYGNPAQILALVQGANYGHGPGIHSMSSGRYGCSNWLAGAVQADECTYMIPGPGERIFAGTQDNEMSFAIPYSKIDRLVDGLNYIRSKGAYRYPVPNLGIMAEPRLPEKYFSIIDKPEDD